MLDGIEIRLARPEEYGAVGDLTADAYIADGMAHSDYLLTLRDAAARAAAGDLLVAVDAATGDVLGTASLFQISAGPKWAEWAASSDDATLRMLAVSPGARRRGIARALTVESIRRAREMGLRRLLLSTGPAMTAAQRLYEQLGFRRAPEADWTPVPGVSLLAYWLPLEETTGEHESAGPSR
ncbi:MAG TPA: GNAT family N-acetyltransferase [Candidatus Binatia bacterium]|nr:GNAT family N-acetyltransferase [Candidatus Binatia bacterium]